jgi:hypothetical protein
MPFVSKRPALDLTEDEIQQLETVSKSRTQPERAVERSKILLKFHEGNQVLKLRAIWAPIDLKLSEQLAKP